MHYNTAIHFKSRTKTPAAENKHIWRITIMKKIAKLAALLLAMLMVVAAFAGCTAKDDNVLVMVTNAEFPPYEYYDGNEIVGIDAEIAAAIAEKLGMELQIDDIDFDSIISSVQSGKADFGMAGMTVTEERLENVNFTTSYATGIQVVIVKEGSAIKTVDDLYADGATYAVGVQTATTGDIYITSDIADLELGLTVERFSKGADAVLALANGQIDCVIIDNEPAKAFVANHEGLTILDTEYAVEDYAIAIAKDNTELLEKVNTALEELIEDGTVQQIVDKYISAE